MGRRSRSPNRSFSQFHCRPFRDLSRLSIATKPAAAPPHPRVADPEPSEDPDELFRREMAGVRPLASEERTRVPNPPPARNPRQIVNEDAEALAELSDLVGGGGSFDIAATNEYVEAHVVGVDPRLVRRLRSGEFAYQSHLDLHGLTIEQAKEAVDRFLAHAHQQGLRCVLLIHGRGLNSHGQIPVLKTWLASWLARGRWARLVLAFTSARPCDGGAGALYVLLRKERHRKHPIRVTLGSKI